MIEEAPLSINDIAGGGIQRKTSKFLKRDNEVDLLINGSTSRVGAIEKFPGYTQKGNDVPSGWTTGDSTTTSTSTSTSTTSTSTSSSSTTTMA